VVAVNRFDDGLAYTTDEVAAALNLESHVPVMLCDARERASARDALIALVEHVIAAGEQRQPAMPFASR
jgi:signal recognition particle receptor subunit beta